MAYPTPHLISALREAANQLEKADTPYIWGHHAHCNCGHLLRLLTGKKTEAIHRLAIERPGTWSEIAAGYCPDSGLEIDLMISKLKDYGLDHTDFQHLEFLSDKAVLQFLPGGFRWLKRNQKADVVAYFLAFAKKLESDRAALSSPKGAAARASALSYSNPVPM
jgi:hypothetical protein